MEEFKIVYYGVYFDEDGKENGRTGDITEIHKAADAKKAARFFIQSIIDSVAEKDKIDNIELVMDGTGKSDCDINLWSEEKLVKGYRVVSIDENR